MEIFITGGTGFLGQAVMHACLNADHTIRVMVHKSSKLPSGVRGIEVRFEEKERLQDALTGCDAILHLAGKVSRDPRDAPLLERLHVTATKQLLEAAEVAKVGRIVLASTSGTIAVSKNKREPATEKENAPQEIISRWPYYKTKWDQERELLEWARFGRIDAIVLNPSLILGPGDEHLSSTGDVLNVLNGKLPAVPTGTVALVDVRDCAKTFVTALRAGQSGERYLLNGANMSVKRFCEVVAHAGAVPPPRFSLPGSLARVSAKLLGSILSVDETSVDISSHHWTCDASRAQRVLGFVPRDPLQTIEDTVRYLEQKGHVLRG